MTKLIVGLGNPGEKYKNTRHNVGFMLIDELSKDSSKGFILTKSDSFMNESGASVKKIIEGRSVKLGNLYIAHDDLDIKLGEFKIQFGKGPKVHNGITSIEEELGTKDFWRIRIGVDNRTPENRTIGENYVLEDFSTEEVGQLVGVLQNIHDYLKNLPK